MFYKIIVTLFIFTFLSPSFMSADSYSLNESLLNYTNVAEWHDKGYTGEGVKIVLSDQGAIDDDLDEVVDLRSVSDINTNINHVSMVIQVIKMVAPDAKIYVSSQSITESINNSLENDAQILNRSLSYSYNYAEDEEKKAYKNNIFMNGASGNHSSYSNNYLSNKYWWSTGAVRINSGYPKRATYSSFGEGLSSVSFSSFPMCESDICNRNTYTYYTGTSFSAPFLSGMVILYNEYYKERNGEFPTVKQVENFIVENSEDLNSNGYDIYTGHGLFILPEIKTNISGCSMTHAKGNEKAIKMVKPDGSISYVHRDYVLEYQDNYGYKVYGCD